MNDSQASSFAEECVAIPYAGAALLATLAYPDAGWPRAGIVIAGPHPLLGGTRDNNVVCAVARAAAAGGWLSLRFDYCAAQATTAAELNAFWERSSSERDTHRKAELGAALAFCNEITPVRALVGYSFGCAVLGWLMQDFPFELHVALIAPTLDKHDYAPMRHHRCPKLIIAAENDFAVRNTTIEQEARSWPGDPRIERIAHSDHFFRGQESEVSACVVEWLSSDAVSGDREVPRQRSPVGEPR